MTIHHDKLAYGRLAKSSEELTEQQIRDMLALLNADGDGEEDGGAVGSAGCGADNGTHSAAGCTTDKDAHGGAHCTPADSAPADSARGRSEKRGDKARQKRG